MTPRKISKEETEPGQPVTPDQDKAPSKKTRKSAAKAEADVPTSLEETSASAKPAPRKASARTRKLKNGEPGEAAGGEPPTEEKPAAKRTARKPAASKAKGAAGAGPKPPVEELPAAPAETAPAKPSRAARKGQPQSRPALARRDAIPEGGPTPPHREALGFAESVETATALLERARLREETLASLEMPVQHERTRLVLMVRDPEWLYAYWEIAPLDRETHQIGWPHGAPPLLLRIFDLGIGNEPEETEEFFDVTIIADATGWYVRTPHAGGHWTGALGYLDQEANFVPICQSNIVTTPTYIEGEWDELAWGPQTEGEALEQADGPGAQRGRELQPVTPRQSEASEQAGRLRPGASEQIGLRPGASEQAVGLRPGASEQVGLRPGASELAVPGSVRIEQFVEQVPKGFWLQVHTELIVYGATEPTARVTIQGNPVRLRPDGTFTLRFALPDGEQVIPVRAVSADGDLERIITSTVTKKTS